jgi:hypothetical protein
MDWKEEAMEFAKSEERRGEEKRRQEAEEARQRLIDAAMGAANLIGVPIGDLKEWRINEHNIEWEVDGLMVLFSAIYGKTITLYHEAFYAGNRQVRDKRQLGEALRDIVEWEKKNGNPL